MVSPGGTDASSGRGRAGERIERIGRIGRIDQTPRWLLPAGLFVVLAYAAAELWLVGRAGFPLDDSWIHLQFARNLADGNGLSYDSGRLVTGSTAPLWTALLSLGMGLPGGGLLAAKLLGIALHLLGIALTYRLARELALPRGLATLAAAWTLSTSWLVWSALSGMEIPLFIVLSLGGMVLAIRERRAESGDGVARPPLSFALFALGALARPEGALLLLLAVVDRLLRWRRRGPVLELVRPPWRALAVGLALAALVLIPAALVYAAIGGSPLPTTFGSKAGAVRRWWPDAQYAYLVLGILFRPLPFAVLAAGAGALALVPRLGTRRDCGLLPALWLLALPLVYSMLSPEGKHLLVGNFGRYFFPLLPVVAVLGALGIERAWDALADVRAGRGGRMPLPLRAVGVAMLLVPTLLTLATGATRYAQNVANVQDGDVAMALWLRPRLDPRALLAVQDIGALKFLLPNPVLDLSGIVDPELQAHVRAANDPAAATLAFLERRRPDYLVVFPAWYPRIAHGAGFHELHRLAIPGNVTAAGAEIVLYATPWTRYPLALPPHLQSPGDSR